jgi:hypothetical protein
MERDQALSQAVQGPASQIVRKVQSGQPITQQERDFLKQSLLTAAPASQEWKAYSAALTMANTREGGVSAAPQPAYVGGEPANYGHNIVFSPPINGVPTAGTPDQRFGTPQPSDAGPSGQGFVYTPGGGDIRSQLAAAQSGTPVGAGGSSANGGTIGSDWGPGGSSGVANSALLSGADVASRDWDTSQVPIDPVHGGMNAYGLEHYVDDPQYASEMFSQQLSGGKGNYMSQYYEAPMTAALALAKAGVLGTGHGSTLAGGGEGSNQIASEADQFMQQMYGGDQAMFPNVDDMINEIYNRALNTNFTTKTDSSGRDITVDSMIDTTNNALYQISAFMPKDSQDWLASTLNGAAKQYKLDFGKGETTLSYPEYLRKMGITDALGIQ